MPPAGRDIGKRLQYETPQMQSGMRQHQIVRRMRGVRLAPPCGPIGTDGSMPVQQIDIQSARMPASLTNPLEAMLDTMTQRKQRSGRKVALYRQNRIREPWLIRRPDRRRYVYRGGGDNLAAVLAQCPRRHRQHIRRRSGPTSEIAAKSKQDHRAAALTWPRS